MLDSKIKWELRDEHGFNPNSVCINTVLQYRENKSWSCIAITSVSKQALKWHWVKYLIWRKQDCNFFFVCLFFLIKKSSQIKMSIGIKYIFYLCVFFLKKCELAQFHHKVAQHCFVLVHFLKDWRVHSLIPCHCIS